MPDRDSKSGALTNVDETLKKTIGFPAHLHGDPRRQAVPSMYALPIHELKKGVKLGDTFGCCGP